ncbi:MAG: TRAP transporter small permease subunit [Pseudomonadota bacterium]
MSVRHGLERINKGVAALVTAAASLCLFAMMGVVVADVVLRAVNPAWRIYGALDLVEFSLNWTLCLSIAAALLAGQAISVDLIDRVDRRGLFQRLGALLLLAILAVMAWQSIRPALNVREWGEETFDLGLPKFWYWIAIWTGLGLAILGVALNLVLQARRK